MYTFECCKIKLHFHINKEIHHNKLGVPKLHMKEKTIQKCLIILPVHLDCCGIKRTKKKQKKNINVVFGHATLQLSRKSISI